MDIATLYQKLEPLIPYLIPLLLLQYGLLIWALVALLRPKTPPRYLDKWVWLAIIVLLNMIGPILFLSLGRSQDEEA
jgi:hypothetical protein